MGIHPAERNNAVRREGADRVKGCAWGSSGDTKPNSEKLSMASPELATPPGPPFARWGKGWVARAVVRSRATKKGVSKPSQYGQHQPFTAPATRLQDALHRQSKVKQDPPQVVDDLFLRAIHRGERLPGGGHALGPRGRSRARGCGRPGRSRRQPGSHAPEQQVDPVPGARPRRPGASTPASPALRTPVTPRAAS